MAATHWRHTPQVPALPRTSQHLGEKGIEKFQKIIGLIQRPHIIGKAGVDLDEARSRGLRSREHQPKLEGADLQQKLDVAGPVARTCRRWIGIHCTNKLVVADLTGRSLEGLSRKASQEIEWWVQLPHPTQSRHQQRHTRADAKAQLTRPLLVNITGKVFVVVWVVVEWWKDNGLGEWAEPGEWQMARSCFARSSSWISGSPIASTRSREL